ncbi:MAG: phosphoserine phosphatase [Nitriliruptoraceae bacterium]|jgi:phosphoserine phosphatase
MTAPSTVLVHVTGHDHPGITAGLLSILDRQGASVHDMEQLVVRERLTLNVLIGVPATSNVLKELLFFGWESGIDIDFEVVEDVSAREGKQRTVITALGSTLTPGALAGVAAAVASGGGNIDRIVRLSRYPVVSYELVVIEGDVDAMREALVHAAAAYSIDVAMQPERLEAGVKRLVLMDVDSTLIQDEVIELLADEAGCLEAVADITSRAMAGELDFEGSLHARVALLEGLDEAAIDRVRERVRLTPGARTFVRTLKRLGFTVAIVSGGFTAFTDVLRDELGLDHAVANELEIVDGRLTGRTVGPVVDRARKAEVLREIAAIEGFDLSQCVAVGDGANDLDMIAAAGLGIAFNAKPVVSDAADTSVTVPYLDAILFLLGIRREEVERADAAAGVDPETVPVAGLPPI